MSTSLLYHGFGISGVEYQATHYEKKTIIFNAEMTRQSITCKHCKHYRVIFRGRKRRRFHLPPCGGKRCTLQLTIHRVQCENCRKLYWPPLPFARGERRMTRSFERYALGLLRFGTIKDVANHLGVGWDVIKDLHKQRLESEYKNIPLDDVEYVSIDEFAIAKRHTYMTVVTNNASGQILHAVEGRKVEDIAPFFSSLKKSQ